MPEEKKVPCPELPPNLIIAGSSIDVAEIRAWYHELVEAFQEGDDRASFKKAVKCTAYTIGCALGGDKACELLDREC